jgi:hypothetical protein
MVPFAPKTPLPRFVDNGGNSSMEPHLAMDQWTWCFGSISGSSWTSGHLHFLTAESRFVCGCRLLHSNVGNSTAAWHYAVGAPLFGLGAMFGKYQVYPRSAGVTLIGIGLLWIGPAMLP